MCHRGGHATQRAGPPPRPGGGSPTWGVGAGQAATPSASGSGVAGNQPRRGAGSCRPAPAGRWSVEAEGRIPPLAVRHRPVGGGAPHLRRGGLGGAVGDGRQEGRQRAQGARWGAVGDGRQAGRQLVQSTRWSWGHTAGRRPGFGVRLGEGCQPAGQVARRGAKRGGLPPASPGAAPVRTGHDGAPRGGRRPRRRSRGWRGGGLHGGVAGAGGRVAGVVGVHLVRRRVAQARKASATRKLSWPAAGSRCILGK